MKVYFHNNNTMQAVINSKNDITHLNMKNIYNYDKYNNYDKYIFLVI